MRTACLGWIIDEYSFPQWSTEHGFNSLRQQKVTWPGTSTSTSIEVLDLTACESCRLRLKPENSSLNSSPAATNLSKEAAGWEIRSRTRYKITIELLASDKRGVLENFKTIKRKACKATVFRWRFLTKILNFSASINLATCLLFRPLKTLDLVRKSSLCANVLWSLYAPQEQSIYVNRKKIFHFITPSLQLSADMSQQAKDSFHY